VSDKLSIVLDMDDVLTQTNSRWMERCNEDWDDDRAIEKLMGWEIHRWVKPECGKRIYEYLSEPGFFRDLEPLDGAVDGVAELLSGGHDVVIATAAPIDSNTAVEEKKLWVREHLPFFDISDLLICHRKDMLRADLLFDDGSHNLENFRGISVCMDRSWNRGETCSEQRVTCWSDFLSLFDRIVNDTEFKSDLERHSECRLSQVDRYERETKHDD